jgi:hypothetical protein
MKNSSDLQECLIFSKKRLELNAYLKQIQTKAQENISILNDVKSQLSQTIEQNKRLNQILQHIFLYETYKAVNPDLKNLDDPSLLDHFISHGYTEGRKCDERTAIEVVKEKYVYRQTRVVQELSRYYLNSTCQKLTEDSIDEQKTKISCKTIAKTMGTRLSLEDNKDYKFAIKHTLFEPKTKCLASYIPKNGCTNLRYSFAVANNFISGPEDIDWIHSNNQSMIANQESINNSEYTFVILRNPYERLASVFWDKFVSDSEVDALDQSGVNLRNLLGNDKQSNNINSFKDFVNNLWENPLLISKDHHLRYQTDFLLLSSYDDYFSLNNFEKLQKTLLEKVCLKIIDTREFTKHTTFGYEKNAEGYYGSCSIEELIAIKSRKASIKYNNLYDQEDAYKATVLYYNDIVTYIQKTDDLGSIANYLREALLHSTNYQF